MVRNFGKGGKNHRKMKNSIVAHSRELVFKEHSEDYALVTKVLGSGRLLGRCSEDNVERLCIIRGSLRVGQINRIKQGDVVLVSLREYQDMKADVIHVYLQDEVKTLIAYEEITNKFVSIIDNEIHKFDGLDENIIFDTNHDAEL